MLPVYPRKWAPAKTRTCPYYARVLWYGGKILQSDAAAKMCTNREFGHPTHCILHTQYILHTVVKTCCWVLTANLTDSEGFAHFLVKVCLGTKLVSLLTRLFHLVLSSNFRLSKEMHIISPSNIAVHVHCTQVTLVPFTKLLQIPVFYSCFILHSILPSIPCLTTKWKLVPFTKLLQIPVFYSCLSCIAFSLQFLASQQNEKNKTKTSITSWQKEKEKNKWSATVSKCSPSSKTLAKSGLEPDSYTEPHRSE